MPRQKKRRKCFASDCCLGLLKSGATRTSKRELLKNNSVDIMTPKGKKKHVSAPVSWYRFTAHRCRHLLGTVCLWKHIIVIPTHHWTLSCHFDDLAHHYFQEGRNSDHYFCRPGISSTHAYAIARRQSRLPTQLVIFGHFRLGPWK